ncbi:nucleotide exchange factor GrpE [Brachyspira catarrhinii]|uniref:Protein GrpE n=1 Tax=Brachyspira catarrhinii TaxID=2528966 RepID=A0ABY2TPT1_9SPIR|nr:nucleotide exchange factor GrpE [Brachyspira catarrhinii]TKZ33915.1 nucleotide exchange factor GrpE [Brachyspira catarrhinii]
MEESKMENSEELQEINEANKTDENIETEEELKNNKENYNEENKNDKENELNKKIEELENQNADLKDKYMRAMAEMENIRKRAAKEKIDTIKRANKDLLLSLLNFMDNFERAIKAGENNNDIQNSEYYKGIELIHKQFIDFIHDNGVEEIECLGEEFNPNLHEALTMVEIPDCEHEKIVEVYAKGYKLNDELLRTAKVIVGKPKAKE